MGLVGQKQCAIDPVSARMIGETLCQLLGFFFYLFKNKLLK